MSPDMRHLLDVLTHLPAKDMDELARVFSGLREASTQDRAWRFKSLFAALMQRPPSDAALRARVKRLRGAPEDHELPPRYY